GRSGAHDQHRAGTAAARKSRVAVRLSSPPDTVDALPRLLARTWLSPQEWEAPIVEFLDSQDSPAAPLLQFAQQVSKALGAHLHGQIGPCLLRIVAAVIALHVSFSCLNLVASSGVAACGAPGQPDLVTLCCQPLQHSTPPPSASPSASPS